MSYELGKEYDDKSREMAYPNSLSPKPLRDAFQSAQEYGEALGEWEEKRDAQKKEREAYRDAQSTLAQEFKTAIAKELGLTNHPKFDALYAIAYDQCHSDGYYAVAQRCDTLAELLQD